MILFVLFLQDHRFKFSLFLADMIPKKQTKEEVEGYTYIIRWIFTKCIEQCRMYDSRYT